MVEAVVPELIVFVVVTLRCAVLSANHLSSQVCHLMVIDPWLIHVMYLVHQVEVVGTVLQQLLLLQQPPIVVVEEVLLVVVIVLLQMELLVLYSSDIQMNIKQQLVFLVTHQLQHSLDIVFIASMAMVPSHSKEVT
jgi:hypothetical protein